MVSALNPATPQAEALAGLWNACMYVCGFIFAVVTISLAYILVRYRRRNDHEPNQETGSKKLEIAWTAVPLGLIGLLFALSIATARSVDRPVRRAPDIVVTGHQWWWEVRYSANVIAANELHIPIDRDVLIEVETADVIHDFWVPRLGRKVDAIPGHPNFVWMRPLQVGIFEGACAEYCGAQHAWMRFRVIVQSRPEYEEWLSHESLPAQKPTSPDAARGAERFAALTCVNCHNVRGINTQQQYAPDLTHVASRQMLAGERIENTPTNLKAWLHEPNVIKPGSNMPNLNLSADDLSTLTAFLETLK